MGLVLGWTLAVVAAAVAAGSLVRLVSVGGLERYEAAAEGTMAAGMAVMSAPPTAGVYGEQGVWWAAVFAAFGLGGVALSVYRAVQGGWKQLHHGAHHVIGSAAMVLMTLAMPGAMSGATSGPALALAASSAHGMHGMGSMHGSHTGSLHHMPGMEGMGAHAIAGVAESSGAVMAWRSVFGLLALYFLVSAVSAVRARLRGGSRPVPTAGGKRARHGRPRRSRVGLSAPNAALAGHVGMGGSMATMLLMMAA
ncbi:DUF5134 domain-containing protein [Streptomyces sp. 8N706]|uniref:DUF5134 domain-containing protein n=1 Tax=Streptomyces sp. 8N706 TaxID=3457416 RepID=UPI003FCFEBF9